MTGGALMRAIVLLCIGSVFILGARIAATSQDGDHSWQHRLVFIPASFWSSGEVARVNGIITRAANSGFNGVVLDAASTEQLLLTSPPLSRNEVAYLDRMSAVRQHAANLGMHFRLAVFSLGQCFGLLSHDPALVTGYPIVDMPLRRMGGKLVPLSTANIENGSFERHIDEEFDGWVTWRAGVSTFADPTEAVSGCYSVRFDNLAASDGGASMVQMFEVMPFQQYRLKIWFKTEGLTADWLSVSVNGVDDDGWVDWDRRLSSQWLSYPSPDGNGTERNHKSYFSSAHDFTLVWTEVTVSFNSVDLTEVSVALGVAGGRGNGGRIWWDDVRIDSSPTLNVVRRADLPLAIVGADGLAYTEGTDFDSISDPKLGTVIWNGNYDTHHAPPTITVPVDSNIGSGEDVYFSGYHAMLAMSGQVACSMSNPGVYNLMDTVITEGRGHLRARRLPPSLWRDSHRRLGARPSDQLRYHGGGIGGAHCGGDQSCRHTNGKEAASYLERYV